MTSSLISVQPVAYPACIASSSIAVPGSNTEPITAWSASQGWDSTDNLPVNSWLPSGSWVPVDSSEASKALALGHPEKVDYFYGHHDENRIQFSRGRNLTLAPAQRGEPLNYFVYPYVEVDGKKYDAVERKFSFQDMESSGQ